MLLLLRKKYTQLLTIGIEHMAEDNQTTVPEFILLGFTGRPELQTVISMVFLLIYATTVMGNLGMMVLIRISPQLHTPMYYFLAHLSFIDLCYSSAIAPKALEIFLTERKTIAYSGCVAQMFFFTTLITTECFLLASMAYDRYVAICKPLLYRVVMSPMVRVQLVVGSYILGITGASVQTTGAFRLSYCGSSVINHFFCDIPAVIKLSCSNTYIPELVLFIFTTVIAITTALIILVSYTYMITILLQMKSSESRGKAFSTCSSHLTVVTVFYGTASCIYAIPQSKDSLNQAKIVSVFYTLVIPLLNPLIYSLRNKDVKDALRSIIRKMFSKMLRKM
ncbi:olfactory receptor 1052-like [Alligator mississippiensis]|uniref:olfactory receptor 1052-like n=1 Tax=Alligator mississippiensis TaxID=8496 RepID=UPI00287773FC|nr:olfactory receptor 1052-like [Alligator mississippiensis]